MKIVNSVKALTSGKQGERKMGVSEKHEWY